MNTDNDNDKTMIKLRSMADEDGNTQVFEISLKAAQISDLILNAHGDDDDDDDDDDTPREIEVPRVKGNCLAKVVDFMKHHHVEKMKEIPTPLGGSSFDEVRRHDHTLLAHGSFNSQSFFGSCFVSSLEKWILNIESRSRYIGKCDDDDNDP